MGDERKVIRQDVGGDSGVTLVAAMVDDDATWVEVHDTLVDEWLAIAKATREEQGWPLGQEGVLLPVRVGATNLECMHNCGCENDVDFMFTVPGHTDGSRHEAVRLVVICEPCLRRMASPMSQEQISGPVQ